MRCLGIAARSAMRPDGSQDEISETLQRFESEPPPDDLVVDSLRAALEVQQSGLESRVEPSARARVALLGYDRYRELLNDNRMNPANRMVQYYAIGRIAGMVASARDHSPVQ